MCWKKTWMFGLSMLPNYQAKFMKRTPVRYILVKFFNLKEVKCFYKNIGIKNRLSNKASLASGFPKEMEQCLLSFGWKRHWSQNSISSHVHIHMRRQWKDISDTQVLRSMGTLQPFWYNPLKKYLSWMRKRKEKQNKKQPRSEECDIQKCILICETSKIWHCSRNIHLCQ